MATDLCGPMATSGLNEQMGECRYISVLTDIYDINDPDTVLKHLLIQASLEEGTHFYPRFGTRTEKMAACAPMNCKLGHIPMSLMAWRYIGDGTSLSIQVAGRVDLARMPHGHPQIFHPTSSNVVNRVLTIQKSPESPQNLCQVQKSESKAPNRSSEITIRQNRMLPWAIFVVSFLLSLFVGVFYTVSPSHQRSMGDAFTLAGWVANIGSLSLTALAMSSALHLLFPNEKKRICSALQT
ncbi:uncharacterized protein LY89DRAFT_503129 [Mollisia scopiformis]|uniref:Uncharacterized protein n=1 Tax=Mollisia scopiformis TaxID=149040 RepID=A0A194XEU7_MOLSC|nr:uncharacterized protein LY89DRAFT_503129 [Mollisia scopiformis]KUJ18715.1 hypothetical protein LY89DRAFT_503129 [Mollisia scopiformis]